MIIFTWKSVCKWSSSTDPLSTMPKPEDIQEETSSEEEEEEMEQEEVEDGFNALDNIDMDSDEEVRGNIGTTRFDGSRGLDLQNMFCYHNKK